jgi:phosphopantetheinyl transferase
MDGKLTENIYGKCLLNKNNLKVFFIKKRIDIDFLTVEEKQICENLSNKRRSEFIHSRSYIRLILSKILKIKPLEVPLSAPLGKPPSLPKKYGFLSLSHCKDALVFVWSTERIGIDIESIDRKINLNLLSKRILTDIESNKITTLNYSEKCLKFLEIWVIKEAIIKRENEKILRNFRDWELDEKSNLAINSQRKIKLNIRKFNYQNSLIGIATNQLFDLKNNSYMNYF